MRLTLTGATGLIGRSLIRKLASAGAQITVLTRDPQRSEPMLQDMVGTGTISAVAWNPTAEAPPTEALGGRDAIVHLAGETIAQRWSAAAKERIRDSRVAGTANLVDSLRSIAQSGQAPPPVLLSASAIGYYGPHRAEPIDEDAPSGDDFLAQVCIEWERQAAQASDLGLRVAHLRTGVVLDRSGGALASMLPPFKLGIGGPIAGGRQFVSWIHPDDVAGIILAAISDERYCGAVNLTAPTPVTNAELSRTLGRVLHRPAFSPVPALALRLLYGEMATLITTGARVMPARALICGYQFQYPELQPALAAALA